MTFLVNIMNKHYKLIKYLYKRIYINPKKIKMLIYNKKKKSRELALTV